MALAGQRERAPAGRRATRGDKAEGKRREEGEPEEGGGGRGFSVFAGQCVSVYIYGDNANVSAIILHVTETSSRGLQPHATGSTR